MGSEWPAALGISLLFFFYDTEPFDTACLDVQACLGVKPIEISAIPVSWDLKHDQSCWINESMIKIVNCSLKDIKNLEICYWHFEIQFKLSTKLHEHIINNFFNYDFWMRYDNCCQMFARHFRVLNFVTQ